PRARLWSGSISRATGPAMRALMERYTPTQAAAVDDATLVGIWNDEAYQHGSVYNRNHGDDEEIAAWLRSWVGLWSDTDFTTVVKDAVAAEKPFEPIGGWASFVEVCIRDAYMLDSARSPLIDVLPHLALEWMDPAKRPTTMEEAEK